MLSKQRWEMRVEHLEALLFEIKPSTPRPFGGNKQWSGFLDTDGAWCFTATTEQSNQAMMTALKDWCACQSSAPDRRESEEV